MPDKTYPSFSRSALINENLDVIEMPPIDLAEAFQLEIEF